MVRRLRAQRVKPLEAVTGGRRVSTHPRGPDGESIIRKPV